MKAFLSAAFTNQLGEDGRINLDYKRRLEGLISFLEAQGVQVVSAHERESWGENLYEPALALRSDLEAIKKCDAVIALLELPPSPGVLLEVGLALAWSKRLLLAHADNAPLPYLLNGLPDLGVTIIRYKTQDELKALLSMELGTGTSAF